MCQAAPEGVFHWGAWLEDHSLQASSIPFLLLMCAVVLLLLPLLLLLLCLGNPLL